MLQFSFELYLPVVISTHACYFTSIRNNCGPSKQLSPTRLPFQAVDLISSGLPVEDSGNFTTVFDNLPVVDDWI